MPIFPMSRKINKTRKRDQYKKSFFSFIDKKMKQKKGSSKNHDQELQKQFNKMTPEEKEKKDLTIEALRCLSTCDDLEGKKVLKAFEEKYEKNKRRADFLDLFARLA